MSKQCEAGCMHYHGGEVRHHKDCRYYPESMTEMLDAAEAEAEAKVKQVEDDMLYELHFIEQNYDTGRVLDKMYSDPDRTEQYYKGIDDTLEDVKDLIKGVCRDET